MTSAPPIQRSHGAQRGALTPARRRRPRVGRVLLGIFALLLIALIALAALGDAVRSTLRTVQVETSRAREQADLGRVLLLSGDLTGAAAAFDDSAGSFTRARAALDDPAIDVVRRVQLADENVETVAALAEAGRLTARAGVVIAEGLADIAGGTSAFAPRDGQLPIDALVAMRAPLAKAEPMIGDAAARAALSLIHISEPTRPY